MTLSISTLWKLAERMESDMGQPVIVLVKDEQTSTDDYPKVQVATRGAGLGTGARYVSDVSLVASSGFEIFDGVSAIRSDMPFMQFGFPSGHPGSAVVTGVGDCASYRPRLAVTAAWLAHQGRRRRGWVPLLWVTAVVLVSLLTAGLVAVSALSAFDRVPWLTFPFTVATGIGGIWAIWVSSQNLIRRERQRIRGARIDTKR
ncbi:hypothetical protein [Modestobacter excelsi]|uniref:hypothetical protein n=1 Tax=Modestobacter excelsi TaxID=2213161 RepID=UPI00110CA45C|nr:hypothetical protein [Modestobacter excelsi]